MSAPFFFTSKALLEVQSCVRGEKSWANICALFGEKAFKASGKRRDDERELGRKCMKGEVKTQSRPNNNSAQETESGEQ